MLQFGFDPKVNSLGFASITLWSLGYPDEAIEEAKRGLALALEVSHPNSLAGIQSLASMVRQYRREIKAVEQLAESQLAVSSEHGLSFWRALAKIPLGWTLAKQGRTDKGIQLILEGLAEYRATGSGVGLPYHFCLLAEAYCHGGCIDLALESVREGLAISARTGGCEHDPELHRLKGELILAGDSSRVAQSLKCFETAIEIATNQSAKSWELRATMSLARLLAQQGRHGEARTRLAEIYAWFTEGWTCPDLMDTSKSAKVGA